MNRVKKNFLYNLFYQILSIILPLITVPYVSRILGSNGVGVFSYTHSVINYFIMISMLGINNYGNRSIAKNRDDKDKLSKTFISIYTIQMFMTLLMIIVYLVYLFIFDNEYEIIALIQGIYLISTLLDINWFFFGLEKFKLTVTRNTSIKILSLVGIFLLVKTKNDVWIYTLILGGSTLISNLLLFPFLLKEIKIVKVGLNDIMKHVKPIMILFIPVIAISLYKLMDKIMLGSMTVIDEVGFYEQAEKIINLPIGLLTALGTVMLPRISNLVAKGDDETISKYLNNSINFMMFMAFPICFGLISVSENFISIFLGDDFIKSGILINYLAVTILFLSFANVIRTQYLIPREKDGIYIKSVIGGAIVNLVINFILIPNYQSIGACIGTIAAEFVVMFYQTMSVRKELDIKKYIKNILPFFIKSLMMFVLVYSFNYINMNSLLRIFIQVSVGGTIYLLLNYKYINSIIDVKRVFNKFRKKVS